MMGFSHARTTFVRSFIRIDRSFVFIDSFAQRSRLDSSQPFPRFLPPIVRQFFRRPGPGGNLHRELRFRTSKIATYSARCDVVADTSPQLLVGSERVSVETTVQPRLLSTVQLPLLVTTRRDWIPTCPLCLRDHRSNCLNGKLMLLCDCKISVTTHTAPVVIHDIALQLRLHFFVYRLVPRINFGVPKKGEKGQISSCEQDKRNKNKIKIIYLWTDSTNGGG